jgi:3D (Asp-Asp-Asp) domain-containing protein
MINKKHLVTAIVIPSLLASNVVFALQYKKDMNTYENHVKVDNYLITKLNDNIVKMKHNILLDKFVIQSRDKKLDNLNSQLDQLKKENESLKSDNVDLKKQLKQRKGVMNKKYFVITFYTNGYESTQKHIGNKGYGITTSGTRAIEGRTIAAPKSIPFGTKVYIEGIGTRIVEDRGNSITDNHIDVFVGDVNKAKQMGKQTLLVEILD